jgi:DNA processing protein
MSTLVEGDFRSAAGFLALQSLPGVGPATALRAALHATQKEQLLERHGLELGEAFERAQASLDDYASAEVDLVTFFDERYPDRLRDLSDPPPLLYVRGDVELLARDELVAVAGTREPTLFGTSAAESLTGALSDRGWGIVSGLAKGIDTVAHRTAVARGAPTIAVMGGGLDHIYPAENTDLAAQILDSGGALLSEQPFGERSRPYYLIARDRLQSGLSAAVVVVQSAVKDGTMYTARFAAAQGRPLFCPIPRSENSANEGLRALLERPAQELCSVLPAWRDAKKLCARLGNQPLAQPVRRDGLEEFVQAVEVARRSLMLSSSSARRRASLG